MNRIRELTRLLGCIHPVVLAGMGGVARAELCAAVSAAGGFGLLGMVREAPDFIRDQIRQVRKRTGAPFGVSLIPYATEAALLEREIAVCIEERVHAVCLFWDVDQAAVFRLKRAGIRVLHQVGTLGAAWDALRAGADVIIAQGLEAGGHVHGRTPLADLLPPICAAIPAPVLAAGGITAAADLRLALELGAAGALVGSALLATRESFAHDCHKQAMVERHAAETVLTDRFFINWPPGAAVRVLANSVTAGPAPERIAREVIAHEGGRPILRYSTDSPLANTHGDLEPMPHYAGMGIDGIRRIEPAAAVVTRIAAGAQAHGIGST